MRLQEFAHDATRVFGVHILDVRAFGVLGLGLLVAGCLPGPTYQDPSISLPKSYSRLAPVPTASADLVQWWRGFHDPVLDQLVARGLADNVSIAIAEARVREADALSRRAGNASLSRGAGNMLSGDLSVDARSSGSGADSVATGLTLSVDPFGGRQRAREAALARLQEAGYGAQNARLALLSSLTQAYIDLRFYQASVALQQLDLASRRRTLQDIETLLSVGSATKLDAVRAEALVVESEARIPQLNAGAAHQSNKIATLLGVPAGSLGINLAYPGQQPQLAAPGKIGIPADLVRRRPDIRQAERAYAAAVSDIGTAVAARYPTLNLAGDIVAPLDSALLSSQVLSAGLSLPLFDQPGLAAQVDAVQARADQAYLTWRAAVLTAVEDVESSLAAVAGARLAVAGAARVLRLDNEALDLTRQLLESRGDVTVLDLLDRERAVSEARSTLAENEREYATSTVALYVALGLGPDAQTAVK